MTLVFLSGRKESFYYLTCINLCNNTAVFLSNGYITFLSEQQGFSKVISQSNIYVQTLFWCVEIYMKQAMGKHNIWGIFSQLSLKEKNISKPLQKPQLKVDWATGEFVNAFN